MSKAYPKGDELRAMIDNARKNITDEVKAAVNEAIEATENDDVMNLDPTDVKAQAIITLAAEQAALGEQEKAIKERREQITNALKAMAKDVDIVQVAERSIYRVSRSTPSRLNSAIIRETFPIADYPGLYTAGKEEVRLTLDAEFRKEAIGQSELTS